MAKDRRVMSASLMWIAAAMVVLILVAAFIILFVSARLQQNILKQSPNYTTQQLYQAAEQNIKQGQYDQAETYLQEALKTQDDPTLHSQLAVVEYRLKKYPQSVNEYQKLIDTGVDKPFAYNGLGNIYRDWASADSSHSADYQKLAIQNYQAALKEDEHYVAAYSNLALLDVAMSNKPAAITLLQEGIAKTASSELKHVLINIQS